MDVLTLEEELTEPRVEWEIVRVRKGRDKTILPVDFPIICEIRTKTICEPAVVFLYEKYVKEVAGIPVMNTIDSYANDMKDWFTYLEYFEISWIDVVKQDVIDYAKFMQTHVSPLTEQKYRSATTRRRTNTVERFYEWCAGAVKPQSTPPDGTLLKGGQLVDRTTSTRRAANKGRVKLKNEELERKPKHVLSQPHARRLLLAVGPRPSQVPTSTDDTEFPRVSVFRLALELGLNLGLRVAEVAGITVHDIQQAIASLSDITNPSVVDKMIAEIVDAQVFKIGIKGKGRKFLPVTCPGHLMKEILIYISTERVQSRSRSRRKIESRLLVYGNGRAKGSAIGIRTLQRVIQDGCNNGGLKRIEFREQLDSIGRIIPDAKRPFEVSAYSFHDLRHTFAVWTYYARKDFGDAEPWMYVQKELRHSSVITTMNTYLAEVADFEASVSDNFMAHLNEKAKVR